MTKSILIGTIAFALLAAWPRAQQQPPASQPPPAPAQRGSGQMTPAAPPAWPMIFRALGSMTIGGFTAAGVLRSGGNAAVVALIWIVIGVINVAYARRR